MADTYGIGERAYVAVIDMPEIMEFASFDRKYDGNRKISGCYTRYQYGSSERVFW